MAFINFDFSRYSAKKISGLVSLTKPIPGISKYQLNLDKFHEDTGLKIANESYIIDYAFIALKKAQLQNEINRINIFILELQKIENDMKALDI